MKHFLTSNNEVMGIDKGQEFLINDDWKLLTDEELDSILNPPKTEEQIQAEFRAERDKLINEADILINKALDNGQDTTSLRTYRQALRDATINWVMPKLEDYLNVPLS